VQVVRLILEHCGQVSVERHPTVWAPGVALKSRGPFAAPSSELVVRRKQVVVDDETRSVLQSFDPLDAEVRVDERDVEMLGEPLVCHDFRAIESPEAYCVQWSGKPGCSWEHPDEWFIRQRAPSALIRGGELVDVLVPTHEVDRLLRVTELACRRV